MNLRRLIMIGGLLALASQTSVAFQEQQGGVEPAASSAAPVAPAQLDAPSAPAAKSEGTEVSIPGFGKLGVLPKMDFGLELLYGANQDPPPADAAAPPEELPDDKDLTIRGSIKKNF